jgi:hypothetical protein
MLWMTGCLIFAYYSPRGFMDCPIFCVVGALKDLAAKQSLERGIDNGKGGAFLKLTPAQYQKLKGR